MSRSMRYSSLTVSCAADVRRTSSFWTVRVTNQSRSMLQRMKCSVCESFEAATSTMPCASCAESIFSWSKVARHPAMGVCFRSSLHPPVRRGAGPCVAPGDFAYRCDGGNGLRIYHVQAHSNDRRLHPKTQMCFDPDSTLPFWLGDAYPWRASPHLMRSSHQEWPHG